MSDETTKDQPEASQPALSGECDCCGYEHLPTERYDDPLYEPMELCRLCAGSFAGNTLRHPGRYVDEASLRTICFVGNAVLDRLGAFDEWRLGGDG